MPPTKEYGLLRESCGHWLCECTLLSLVARYIGGRADGLGQVHAGALAAAAESCLCVVGSGYGLSTLVRWDVGSKGLIGMLGRYFAVHSIFGSDFTVYLDVILDTTMDRLRLEYGMLEEVL